jgi:acyl carrier protein
MNDKKSPDEIRKTVLHALHLIAPEVDLEALNPDAPLQQELEIDSMDFLRFMLNLNAELKVDVPEKDYKQLETLTKCINYLNAKINN